ncbi:MAG TPA: hypothetical protein P5274_00570 [Candidatus Paceibacterota bacterium]|nr:hypothetical protein [Candidatus Paceibacterota bacterium]
MNNRIPELNRDWFRGLDKYNIQSGDKFYSASKYVAGDFGKVLKAFVSELPKNPLIVSNKEELSGIVGFDGDPMISVKFDEVAKRYAVSKGYDGIFYHEGTFEEPELHVFKKKK